MLIDKNTKYSKFVKCPMSLLTADIPSTAKVVYLMLLNRLSFAIGKEQCDRYGNPYVVYTIYELAKELGTSDSTIVSNLNQLEKFGLIERFHTKRGMAQRIYLNNPDDICCIETDDDDDIFGCVIYDDEFSTTAQKTVANDDEFSTTAQKTDTDDDEILSTTAQKIIPDRSENANTTTQKISTVPLRKSASIYTTDTTYNTTSLYTTDNTIPAYPEKEREKTVENGSANSAKETDDWNTELEAIRARVRMINEKYNTRYKP